MEFQQCEMTEEPTSYHKYEVQSLLNLNNKSEFKLERIFNMYKQQGSTHFFYNILNKIEYPENVTPSVTTIYHTKPGETWPRLSFRFYNRIDLWWLIAGLNRIDDTFKPIPTGLRLVIPTPQYVRTILDSIKTQI